MFSPRLSFIASRINGVERYSFGEIGQRYTLARNPDNGFWYARNVTNPRAIIKRDGWFQSRTMAVSHIMEDAAFHL